MSIDHKATFYYTIEQKHEDIHTNTRRSYSNVPVLLILILTATWVVLLWASLSEVCTVVLIEWLACLSLTIVPSGSSSNSTCIGVGTPRQVLMLLYIEFFVIIIVFLFFIVFFVFFCSDFPSIHQGLRLSCGLSYQRLDMSWIDAISRSHSSIKRSSRVIRIAS